MGSLTPRERVDAPFGRVTAEQRQEGDDRVLDRRADKRRPGIPEGSSGSRPTSYFNLE